MLKLISGPASEPVTLAELKAQCRVEHSAEDDLLTAYGIAARQQCESILERALITQTWARMLDCFPWSEIELGKPPVQAITSISYVDTAGATQTLSSSAYVLDPTGEEPGFVLPAYSYTWPTTLDTAGAVTITFTCGYGAAAAVPDAIKTWIRMRVATLYRFRESIGAGMSMQEVPSRHLDGLLDPYRVMLAY